MDGNGGSSGIDGFDHQAGRSGDRPVCLFRRHCEFCHQGLYTNCLHGGFWAQAHDEGQAEVIRAPFADSTLVVVPSSVEGDEARLRAILPLTNVMGTGHHAAVSAEVHAGGTVAIVGDGAVGLCGVLYDALFALYFDCVV
jgi:alcohol dehydrogenase